MRAPFRVTLRGFIADCETKDVTNNGKAKRQFELVDSHGVFVNCCALGKHAENAAIQNASEVVIYFGTGRGPIGGLPGMIYLMKDSLIVPLGQKFLPPGKKSQIEIKIAA